MDQAVDELAEVRSAVNVRGSSGVWPMSTNLDNPRHQRLSYIRRARCSRMECLFDRVLPRSKHAMSDDLQNDRDLSMFLAGVNC